jgi:hypothetical protein
MDPLMFTEHLLCDLSLWPVLKCPPREARIDPSLNVTHDMRPLPPLDGGN